LNFNSNSIIWNQILFDSIQFNSIHMKETNLKKLTSSSNFWRFEILRMFQIWRNQVEFTNFGIPWSLIHVFEIYSSISFNSTWNYFEISYIVTNCQNYGYLQASHAFLIQVNSRIIDTTSCIINHIDSITDRIFTNDE
jgi:hypothetical protein